VDNSLDIEGKLTCTSVQRGVALSSISPKEEREMIELFHNNIKLKQAKVDSLFDPES
jgi:hypothetical protein